LRIAWHANPLIFHVNSELGACGRIGDVVLAYRGMEMQLFIDADEHNTFYEIESPPFQNATFRLRALPCVDGGRPPAIDNRTSGKCVVSSLNWQGMDEEWVRHLVPIFGKGGLFNTPVAECDSNEVVRAVTKRSEWVELYRGYPEVLGFEPFPEIDFLTTMIVAVYRRSRGPGYSLDAMRVDRRGNLTFVYSSPPTSQSACSLTVLALFRSGVRSVHGTPLAAGERGATTSYGQ
jgi:hypothetical protein